MPTPIDLTLGHACLQQIVALRYHDHYLHTSLYHCVGEEEAKGRVCKEE